MEKQHRMQKGFLTFAFGAPARLATPPLKTLIFTSTYTTPPAYFSAPIPLYGDDQGEIRFNDVIVIISVGVFTVPQAVKSLETAIAYAGPKR